MPASPAEHFLAILRNAFGGKRVVLTGGALSPAQIRWVRALGAEAVFALGGSHDQADAGVDLAFHATEGREHFLRREALLRDLPPTAEAALDAFDPRREAIILGDNFYRWSRLAGRRYIGRQPERRTRWNDKTRVRRLWKAADVTVAPEEIVAPTLAALTGAASSLDRGQGTVWSGDSREWPASGGELVRWVRTPDEQASAADELAAQTWRVRVMPFLEGVPCAIHAFVTADGIAVFRPVEQIVLRSKSNRFMWAGASTAWQPSADESAGMRAAARRVGEVLGEQSGYRGAFTIDGVMTADGFRPTELNPRWGSALLVLAQGPMLRVLPLRLLHCILAGNQRAEWRPDLLERLVLDIADANPRMQCWLHSDAPFAPIEERVGEVVIHRTERARGGEVWLEAPLPPGGESFAPIAAAALSRADAAYGLGWGPLTSSVECRRRAQS